jgi:SAM-dependent methyltransferase
MSATSQFQYVGGELAVFEKARKWKSYWRDEIAPYIRGDVLEAGAGIGANTKLLAELGFDSWTALEPDSRLAAQIEPPSDRHRTIAGTIADLNGRFDAILYIDVLEHIEDDRAELLRAAERLHPGGTLIVLSPAHPFLYTPFDGAIGHYRRYTRSSLAAAAPGCMCPLRIAYLDSVGMLASAGNRLLLKAAMPTERQILAWDRLLVPVSRAVDRLFGGRVGKSVLGIWRRESW